MGHDDASDVLRLLGRVADAVGESLHSQTEWGLAPDGAHGAQYAHDRTADEAALAVLAEARVSVLSEESGRRGEGSTVVTVVVDPIDGSTNASRRLPWWSTALCAVDRVGAWVALVHDHTTGERFHAIRNGGAFRSFDRGQPARMMRPGTPTLGGSVISVGGWPHRHGGWAQFRSYGSLALELCAVADGRLDGHVQFVTDEVAPWDYLAGALVCAEAGAVVVDAFGRDLLELTHHTRRTPVAAGSEGLLADLVALRREGPWPGSAVRH